MKAAHFQPLHDRGADSGRLDRIEHVRQFESVLRGHVPREINLKCNEHLTSSLTPFTWSAWEDKTHTVIPLPRAFRGGTTSGKGALLVLTSTSLARRMTVTAQFAPGLPDATWNAGLVGPLEVPLGGAGARFLHYS